MRTRMALSGGHPGNYFDGNIGDRVEKFQGFCAQPLGLPRELCAVLGVCQNRETHIGAVDPQLVGATGDRLQG